MGRKHARGDDSVPEACGDSQTGKKHARGDANTPEHAGDEARSAAARSKRASSDGLVTPCIHRTPLLEPRMCLHLMQLAEEAAAQRGGWVSPPCKDGPSGKDTNTHLDSSPAPPAAPEYRQSTIDLEVDQCPQIRRFLTDVGFVDALQALYSDKHGRRITAFDDVFIVRYSCDDDDDDDTGQEGGEGGGDGQQSVKTSQRGLVEHTDAGDVSFMLALSRPGVDFKGGGTRFKSGDKLGLCGLGDEKKKKKKMMKKEGKKGCEEDGSVVVQCDQGTVLSFPAALRHAGVPITSGTRMLLVGFCFLDEAQAGQTGNVDLSLKLCT